MKKSLLYALPITLVLGSTVAFAMASQQQETVKNTVKESTTMTPEASPEATPAAQQETATQSSTPVSTPQMPQETLESLIAKYQWDMSGGVNGTLGQWMRRWPQYFTQTEMSTTFKYMHDVGLAYVKMTGKKDIDPALEGAIANGGWNLLYNWGGAGEQGGTPEKDAVRWIFMGKYTGIDTSHYN